MFVGTAISTEEQYANFLAQDAGDNPLLQSRPSWAELVAQSKVEDGKVAIMVYPDHVSYTRPSDLDAMHESGELETVPDVYSTAIILPGAYNWDGKSDYNLVDDLKALRADIDRALMLLGKADVDLTFDDYDHHYGGSTCFMFETTDAEVAEKLNFDQVTYAGNDDAEDTPWTKQEGE